MAKYVRSLDPRRNIRLKKKYRVKELEQQLICHCKEAAEGEHECHAVDAKELLDNILKSR